jgi:hypothetical protein
LRRPLPTQPWIYVSAGRAHLRSFEGVGHEYVIRTWQQERLMVELLAAVASYSTREDLDGLHDGHTVPITVREKEWRHEHGQEAVEQWLEDHSVTPEDPARRSTI